VLRKLVSCVLFSILLTSTLVALKTNPVRSQDTITVPDDFPTIQKAINNANSGDTIYVRAGVYMENVLINKTVTLAGENRSSVIVDGQGLGDVITIFADNVGVSEFTIRGGGRGIFIQARYASIAQNIITENGGKGIDLEGHRNTLVDNDISENGGSAVYVCFAHENTIDKNRISGNISLHDFADVNVISCNNFFSGTLWCDNAAGNLIYHNNFFNGGGGVGLSYYNYWDFRWEGNYWSSYTGSDADGDGIGDTPYFLDDLNQDNYPLMSPYMLGDINHDGIVDIFDCAKMGLAFSSTPISPNWNPHCDVNEDNVVDIFDLVVVAVNFGKEWTPP
jgi:parallel beta-helix repeat protein